MAAASPFCEGRETILSGEKSWADAPHKARVAPPPVHNSGGGFYHAIVAYLMSDDVPFIVQGQFCFAVAMRPVQASLNAA